MIHVMHCREIAAILDSDQFQQLSWVNRIQVRVHLWVCWHCRVLVRQIQMLGRAARKRAQIRDKEAVGLESRILKKLSSSL